MLTFFIYLCIVAASALQSAATKLYSGENDNVLLFNAVKSLSALIIFVIMSLTGLKITESAAFYGLLYGAFLSVSMYFGYMALSSGPMAITSMIVSFSVAVPVLYGVIFRNEGLGAFKLAGFAFLILAVFFSNAPAVSFEENTGSAKWFLYVALTFVSNGACSVIQKMYREKSADGGYTEFMLCAMLVCCAFFVMSAFKNRAFRGSGNFRTNGYAVLSGAANAASGYFTIVLSGLENASVMFPAISAGTLMCCMLCGIFVFGEKMRTHNVLSAICGIVCVALLKI